jgi:hypothetical protein
MSTENMPSAAQASISEHPDIVAMSTHYEQVAETPAARAVDGLTMLAGLFIALSPWIAGFNAMGALAISNFVIGLTIAALGAGFSVAYNRTHRLEWVTPLLGVWVIVSLWIINGVTTTTASTLCNVIAGALVVILSLGAFWSEMDSRLRR